MYNQFTVILGLVTALVIGSLLADPATVLSSQSLAMTADVEMDASPLPTPVPVQGWTGNGLQVTLTLVLDRKGQLSVNNLRIDTNRVCRIVGARMERIGQFPLVIKAEVATRPEVAAPVIEMLKGTGVTNIQYMATDKTALELTGCRPRAYSLADSRPLSFLSLALYLSMGLVVLGVTRWYGRNAVTTSGAEDNPEHRVVMSGRYVLRGVLAAMFGTLLAWVLSVWTPSQTVHWVNDATWWIVAPAGAVISLTDLPLVYYGNTEVLRLIALGVALSINGVVGAWVGYVISLIRLAPEPAWSGRSVEWFRRSLVLAPLVLPVFLYLAYGPVNEKYTGELFGCGCTSGFNANCVNMILGSLVFWLCSAMLFVGARYLKKRWRIAYLGGGFVVVLIVTGWCYSRLMFM